MRKTANGLLSKVIQPMKIPVLDNFFFGAEVFFSLLKSFRIYWGAGGFGSGKTAVSVLVAAELVSRGLVDKVVSNIDIKGKSGVNDVVPDGCKYYSENLRKWYFPGQRLPLENAAIVLDEAHLFLDSWRVAKDYVSALRKANVYLLLPSIWPPHVRLRFLEVRRTLNLYAYGLPAWRYHWALTNGTIAEQGHFNVFRPDRMFGIYNTADFPADDGGIVDAMRYTFGLDKDDDNEEGQQTGRGRNRKNGNRKAGTESDLSAFEDAINSIPDSIAYFSGYGSRKRSR